MRPQRIQMCLGQVIFSPYLDSQAPTAVVIGRTVRTAGQMSVSWKEFGAVHK